MKLISLHVEQKKCIAAITAITINIGGAKLSGTARIASIFSAILAKKMTAS